MPRSFSVTRELAEFVNLLLSFDRLGRFRWIIEGDTASRRYPRVFSDRMMRKWLRGESRVSISNAFVRRVLGNFKGMQVFLKTERERERERGRGRGKRREKARRGQRTARGMKTKTYLQRRTNCKRIIPPMSGNGRVYPPACIKNTLLIREAVRMRARAHGVV